MSEVRIALRRLLRSPLYTVLSVLLLALGIGATTGLYSAVDAVLLRALPYPQPEQLVVPWVDASARGFSDKDVTNPADLSTWRESLRSFSEMAGYTTWQVDLTGSAEPTQLNAAQVTQGYFATLGVPLAAGRDFSAAEDLPNGPRVVVISHSFWREHFAADPQAIGQSLTLQGEPHTVIGIAAEGLIAPGMPGTSLWRPLQGDPDARGGYFLSALARLKAGVSISVAAAEFDALQQQLAKQFPDSNRDHRGSLERLDQFLAAGVRAQLWVLFAATGVVLLVALAILLNLGLARVTRDRREWAVRAALGAERWRLLRLAIAESVWLASIGAALALPLAWAILRWINGTMLSTGGVDAAPALDWRVLGFCVALSLLVGLLSGVLPLLLGTRFKLAAVLRDGDRASAGGRNGERLRASLVVVTFALALMLSVGAGLFVTSLERLRQVDPGFQAAGVVTFTLALNPQRYPERAELVAFSERLRERLDAVPGVAISGMTSALPLANYVTDTQVLPEGMDAAGDGARAFYNKASPGYLAAMGATLLRGREFSSADNRDGPCVVMSNQRFAEQHFPSVDALGKRVAFNFNGPNPLNCEIVGVVGDIRSNQLDTPEVPSLFLPLSFFGDRFLFVAVRGQGDPLTLLPALRAALAEIDPLLAMGHPQTMTTLVDASMSNQRTLANLSGAFSLATLLLAAVGVYGVLAYSVAQRRRELGVRAALGASGWRLTHDVVGRGLRLAGLGIATGLLLALLAANALESMLYETSALEPGVLLSVITVLTLLALLATLPPAWRAARSDPMGALRHD